MQSRAATIVPLVIAALSLATCAGPVGPTGVNGATGPSGAEGPTGATGPAGEPGENGATGPTGPAGSGGGGGADGGTPSRIVVTGPSGSMTVNGLFLGETNTTTNGAFSYSGYAGYLAAKKMCEDYAATVSTVNASDAKLAHMCDTTEITRSAQVGAIPNSISPAWINAGEGVDLQYSHSGFNCRGWTDTSPSDLGIFVDRDGAGAVDFGTGNCSIAQDPIACCL